jgi:hypothetical protein
MTLGRIQVQIYSAVPKSFAFEFSYGLAIAARLWCHMLWWGRSRAEAETLVVSNCSALLVSAPIVVLHGRTSNRSESAEVLRGITASKLAGIRFGVVLVRLVTFIQCRIEKLHPLAFGSGPAAEKTLQILLEMTRNSIS